MKLYPDYKKLFKHTRQDLVIILQGLALVIFLLTPLVFSHAETADEIRNKINQKSFEIAKLEEQIRIFQNELDGLGKQKDSLSVSIKQLDITKKKLNADIAVTQNQVDKTNLEIENLISD